MVGKGEGAGQLSDQEKDERSKAKKVSRTIIVPGDLTGDNLNLGFNNTIDGVLQENSTLPPNAKLVESYGDEDELKDEGLGGDDGAGENPNSSFNVSAFNKMMEELIQGVATEVERSDNSLKAQDGQVVVGGVVGGSRVYVGNNMEVNGSTPELDLPVDSVIWIPPDVRAGTFTDATIHVIQNGQKVLRTLKGQWESEAERDAEGNRKYKRYK